MNGVIVRWLTLTAAIIVASYMIEGIRVTGVFSAVFAAAALGFFNAVFRPVVMILTLPINLLSLGLFTFVINAVMLKLASGIIPGFDVHGFWASVGGAFLISIISWFLNAFIGGHGHVESIDLRHKGGNRWE
jgi:putative membrane protein